jgi:diguanylate cyclase (GGDEF)-like protein
MPQKIIDFRELLERVLPLDALAPADRRQIQHVLKTGVAEQIEQAALLAIAQLERKGEMKRLPSRDRSEGVIRYQPRDGIDVITIQLPQTMRRDGVELVPRSSLPTQAQTALHQVRGLLRLDEPLFSSDPRTGDPRAALLQQLDQIGRELIGVRELRFIPRNGGGAPAAAPLSEEWSSEAAERKDLLYYCPDTFKSETLREPARQAGVRSIAFVAVARGAGETLGVLEVRSSDPDAYVPDTLALIALIADCCASALERAARIERLVFIDPLTAAYNRPYFDLQMRNEMARAQREDASLALCIVDIDDFKSFNNTFGYEAGNQVLVQVAKALRSGVRPFDAVCRWGGEEFAVLLTAPVQLADVRTISERLRQLVERQAVRVEALDGQAHRVVVTVSIGVAVYPQHETSAGDLWRAANQALLLAKRPPKNQVVFYSPPTPTPR